MKIAAVVLAAGASTRMGAPKQLIEFDGKTLLRRAVESAAGTECRPVVVVVGAHAARMLAELDGLPVRVIENAEWSTGMASSLRAGLAEALRREPALDAILVMLCDQPFITGANLAALVELFRAAQKPIAAARYGETLGVPAILAGKLFPEIEALQGDAGARRIIAVHAARSADAVATLDLPAAAVDIDTPTDLSSFSANLH